MCSGNDEKQVNLEYMHLDLASLSSVKQFVVDFQEKNLPLHILINNAGIAWVPLGEFIIRSVIVNVHVFYLCMCVFRSIISQRSVQLCSIA